MSILKFYAPASSERERQSTLTRLAPARLTTLRSTASRPIFVGATLALIATLPAYSQAPMISPPPPARPAATPAKAPAAPVSATVQMPSTPAPAVSAPVAPTLSLPASANILILALDEADINAARINNILQLLPQNTKATKSGASTPASPRVVTPAAPAEAQPREAQPDEIVPVTPLAPPDAPRLAPPPAAPADKAPAGEVPADKAPAAPRAVEPPVVEQPDLELPAPPAENGRQQRMDAVAPVAAAPSTSALVARAFWRANAADLPGFTEVPPGAPVPMISPPATPARAPQRTLEQSTPGALAPSIATETPSYEAESRRPPGRAQNVAAPLRRALVAAGFGDVLTTPLDSATVLRALNSGRLTRQQLDALRFTTGQILEAAKIEGDKGATEEAAPNAALAQSRQIAVATAARIGLTLGYRAVVVLAVAPDTRSIRSAGVYSVMLVDAANETGQAMVLRQEGAQQLKIDQAAAASAASNIAGQVRGWRPFSATDRAAAVQRYLAAAREAMENNDFAAAQDQLNLVVGFDPSNSEAYVLMGDVLQSTDPPAAARAYQRAAEINTRSGEVWAKIAIVHTLSTPPDWIRALQSANRAMQLGYDSANLRTAMAASEFGRAELFRRSSRIEQAEDAELLARQHLERARELAPDSPEVSASVSRLMAKFLLDQKRYKEAVSSLDLLAIQYPDDLQTQTMYARALEGYGRRSEDTFMAWARVWKLSGESQVPLDAVRYAVLADGFDQRLVNLGKNIFQLTYGVSTGAILRESAILQTGRAKDEFQSALAALRLMKPPPGRTASDAHTQRLFAADLMQLAMEHYAIYLETSNDINRVRAVENHKQAIESLNAARNSSGAI